MRVAVTGAAGYIGSTVVPTLLAEGHEVVAVDRLDFGDGGLSAVRAHAGFELVSADVRDARRLSEVLSGCDAVVHLAAVVGEEACDVDPDEAWSINVDGAGTVLDVAGECRLARAVLASTCSNYGVSSPEVVVGEDAPLNPLSSYARAKVRAEQHWLNPSLAKPSGTATTAVTTTVLRFGTICGRSPRMRFDLLVNELAARAALGMPIELYAPEAWRPYLFVADAARAIAAVLGAPEQLVQAEIFNVVGENCSKHQLGGIVHERFPSASITVTERRPDRRDYRVSGAKFEAALGFHDARSVREVFIDVAAAVEAGAWVDPFDRRHTACRQHADTEEAA